MLATLQVLRNVATNQKSVSTPVLSRMLETLETEIEDRLQAKDDELKAVFAEHEKELEAHKQQMADLVPSSFSRAPFRPGGKSYLNNAEKMDFYKLIAFNSFMKNYAQELKRRGWDPGLIKQLNRAFFYSDLACSQVMTNIDPTFIDKILTESSRMSIVAMYSKEALQEYKETLALDSNVPVPREMFYNALVMLDENLCAGCPVWPGDFSECSTYKLFIDQEIDVIQDDPAPGICPFSRYEETDCRLCARYHKKCEATRERRMDGNRCRDFSPKPKV